MRAYIRDYRKSARNELRWFAIQASLPAAIERTALALSPIGKRLHHQRRIPGAVLRAWADTLLERKDRLRRAKTFDDLYRVVEEAGRELHGIGSLAAYDTAHRIGAFLKLTPDQVYLHAGTRVGARALGLGNGAVLKFSELPPAFRMLSPAEAEDCLCIYAAEIARINR